jgi:hypothetical protein
MKNKKSTVKISCFQEFAANYKIRSRIMANINDFKLVAIKSQKYFGFLDKLSSKDFTSLSSISKQRIGFYLYMLENICGIKDISDLSSLITDSEYNQIVNDTKFDDCGVDAIYIDETEKTINIFNFKYREKFNADKNQSINATILSTKFVRSLITESTDGLDSEIKIKADIILEKLLKTNDIWKLNLYVVSNESKSLDKSDIHLKQLEDTYALEIIPVGLDDISKIMSIRPNPVNCEFVVDKDAILSFSESSIASSKSYVIRMIISELVRITCNDESLRNKYNIEDYAPVADKDIDFSVLFDNVRGFVLRSKINPNITKTLKNEPSKFFLYNNGVTIVASDIEAEPINANKKVKLKISNFQVLNGGQTLRSIHAFNQQEIQHINKNLADSEVLIRIFKTTPDSQLTSKIAEYTNSQNSISIIDLKSLSTEQIQIEQYLNEYGIIYSRKVGDIGISPSKTYDYKISMERFGQILYCLMGYPQKATNQKKQIFDRFYDEIFGSSNFKIEQSVTIIKRYFEIKKAYENHVDKYNSSDQKIFFIIYLDQYLETDLASLISSFENDLKLYTPEASKKTTSEARKLLLLTFKEYLDSKYLNIDATKNA